MNNFQTIINICNQDIFIIQSNIFFSHIVMHIYFETNTEQITIMNNYYFKNNDDKLKIELK